jgi:chromosomal replication initiation ATPase DnaA
MSTLHPGLSNAERVQRATELYADIVARGLLPMMQEVAAAHHVTVHAIVSSGRTKRVAEARHVVFARLRVLGFSLPEIGALMGRDHTTVLYGLRKGEAA